MLTVYEMNQEGYEEKVFEGNTLEEFLGDVKSYFKESVDDEEELETILGQAKEAYVEGSGEYVYFSANSYEYNYFLEYEVAWKNEFEAMVDCYENLCEHFDYYDVKKSLEYFYGEGKVKEFKVNIYDSVDWKKDEEEFFDEVINDGYIIKGFNIQKFLDSCSDRYYSYSVLAVK